MKARRSEAWLVLLAAAYLFFLLFSYYLLRPLREAMGIARGAEQLPWLMTATMATMFVANPLHAWIVSRMNRRRFIPWICHFFAVNLAGFYAAFRFLPAHGGVALGYEDEAAPINALRSTRAPAQDWCELRGFA